MALGNNETYLSDLISLGADAQSNLYELTFTGGEFDGDTSLTIRNAGITLPERKQGVHEVNYLTTSLTLPAATYEETKTATIQFRLDQNYEVYKKLLKQQKKMYGPSTSYANPSANAAFTIEVAAVTNPATMATVKMYKLSNCYIKKVKQDTPFSYDNSTPMTVSMEIWYQKREDWAYSTTTTSGGTSAGAGGATSAARAATV